MPDIIGRAFLMEGYWTDAKFACGCHNCKKRISPLERIFYNFKQRITLCSTCGDMLADKPDCEDNRVVY